VDEKSTTRELIELAKIEPVIVREQDGRTFALLEVDETDLEAWSLGQNADFLRIIERSRERAQSEGWLTTEQVRAQLGIPATGGS
jgi:hypothetical protein